MDKKEIKIIENKTVRGVSISLFIIYISFMIYVLYISPYYNRNVQRLDYNLIPFKTIVRYFIYFNNYSLRIWLTNIVGNIVVFIPLGGFLHIIFNRIKTFKSIFYTSIIILFIVELNQRLLKVGSFDIDDIILNTLGSILGYLIVKRICKLIINRGNRKT